MSTPARDPIAFHCPFCLAPPGNYCVTRTTGAVRDTPHTARVEAALPGRPWLHGMFATIQQALDTAAQVRVRTIYGNTYEGMLVEFHIPPPGDDQGLTRIKVGAVSLATRIVQDVELVHAS